MPAFRNVPNRHSGRLGKNIPVIYDKDGWEIPEVVDPLTCHNIKVEPLDARTLSPMLPSTASSTTSSPSLSDTSFSTDRTPVSTAPLRRNSHTRRRDPSHIPRPRNAFILFRSDYIRSGSATGEGQQNELSKHAGKVWNKMSTQQKRPYSEKAAEEKEEHYKKYPNYIYSPGRNGVKAKSKSVCRRKVNGASSSYMKKRKASVVFEEVWSRSSITSSEPATSPGPSPVIPPLRPKKNPRAAAQRAAQRIIQPPSPTPSVRLSPTSDGCSSASDGTSPSPASYVETDYVPTSEIPVLELTPKEQEKQLEPIEPIPEFAPAPFHYHLDPVPEQFGFKHQLYLTDPTLPPLPHITFESDYVDFSIPPIPSLNLNMFARTPTPSSLLSDNSYPTADYLASGSSYSFSYGGDLTPQNRAGEVIKQSPELPFSDLDVNTGIHQFFDIDGYFELPLL